MELPVTPLQVDRPWLPTNGGVHGGAWTSWANWRPLTQWLVSPAALPVLETLTSPEGGPAKEAGPNAVVPGLVPVGAADPVAPGLAPPFGPAKLAKGEVTLAGAFDGATTTRSSIAETSTTNGA